MRSPFNLNGCATVLRLQGGEGGEGVDGGAWLILTRNRWLFFQYAPHEWTGTRVRRNQVSVLHAYKLPGDVDEVPVVERDPTTGEERSRTVSRFRPGSKEKLFVGHAGWHPEDFVFTVGGMTFRRGIFATKAGQSGPWLRVHQLAASVQLKDARRMQWQNMRKAHTYSHQSTKAVPHGAGVRHPQ